MTRDDELEASDAVDALAKIEKMRQAVRRADFFRHINSGTIQHYMSYDPDDEFLRQASMQALDAAGRQSAQLPAYLAFEKLC